MSKVRIIVCQKLPVIIIFHILLSLTPSWINRQESERSGMAVLDVTIPTGYWIQQQKLDSYVLSNRVRNLRRAKYQNSKVIFYFDYVSMEMYSS